VERLALIEFLLEASAALDNLFIFLLEVQCGER
jgi:hypothetical protein